ncbi:GMC oxidoreductase [Stappia indica]|uniref:GMC oxidoreductase n=1 Tax=Stappia indica TaxID=538381 RepID=UPI001CD38B45|nr:GMC oxidoreductase [Stappia indica]MCA1298757.1 GMC family oxidoreductase [Stappia indica]
MRVETIEPDLAANPGVCVIGAGPVGIALALRLGRLRRRVLLIDAGPMSPVTDISGAFKLDLADALTHASSEEATRQGLGGTSSAWGARCSPYEAIDFRMRSYVPHSGAPVGAEELAPYVTPTARFFGVEDHFADDEGEGGKASVRIGRYMRVSPCADMGRRHGAELEASAQVALLLETRVLKLDFDPLAGTVTRIVALRRGERYTLTPRAIVLCCGGIQNARMLLDMQRAFPRFLGGEAGPVGRYYMGHLSGSVARIAFRPPAAARPFQFSANPDGSFVRRIFTFTPAALDREKLLNIYFAPVSYPLGDPDYRSSTLSALHLALSLRFLTTDYMGKFRPGHKTTPFDFRLGMRAHAGNILRQPVGAVTGLYRITRERLGYTQRLPLFQYENPAGIYALRYHAEHAPTPASRVTLSGRSDSEGVPIPRVDFRYSSMDMESVERAHEVFERWLAQHGYGQMHWLQPAERRQEHIRVQASDGFHQIGLTRMSASPETGVVDGDLKVHGTTNLFVSGASVLPTSSYAHPTFTAVSLALRLADFLAAGFV